MEAEIHLISIVLVFIAATVPTYFSFKLKNDLRMLTIFLAIFLFIHAGYHIAGILELDILEDGILEPLSVALLIIFGLIFLKIRKKRKSAYA
ncbi:MAG: hypothetical protein ACT4N5_06235 [Nitrosopumilaceae archaeon]